MKRKYIILAMAFGIALILSACRNEGENTEYPLYDPIFEEEQAAAKSSCEQRAVLLEQSGISEYGWQAAAGFLSQMTSIFTGMPQSETHVNIDREWVWVEGTGRFILGWDFENGQLITTYEIPEIYYALTEHGIRGVYDRQGNRIYDAPWLRAYREGQRPVYFYAMHFNLFNFDDNGIPVIFVFFGYLFDGITTGPRGSYSIFRYIDGEYRELKWRNHEEPSWPWTSSWTVTPWHRLFMDESGRIITLFTDIVNGTFFGYEHLVLTNSCATLYPVSFINPDDMDSRAAWREHHWEPHAEFGYVEVIPTTIFGTETPIMPLLPLQDLGAELYVYLQSSR